MRKSKNAIANKQDKLFNVNIRVVPSNETFILKGMHNDLTILEVKNMAEYAAGIPRSLQRLSYLDEEDLADDSTVQEHDIVSNGELRLNVWLQWKKLVEVAACGDSEILFQLGITKDSTFTSPTLNYMPSQERRQILAERGFVALFIAAHHNNKLLCEILIKAGINVNSKTSTGRTALHIAAARGHEEIIDLLLENGASIGAKDSFGDTAMMVASNFGHKECERHLFLFQWQERAKKLEPQEEHEMFAHQYHDSSQKISLSGSQAQMYVMQVLPPGEFEGTRISAPRSSSASSRASSVKRVVNSNRRSMKTKSQVKS